MTSMHTPIPLTSCRCTPMGPMGPIRRLQTLSAMALLSSLFLIFLYSTHLQMTSSHQTLQEDILKNARLYSNDGGEHPTNQNNVTPHVDTPHIDTPHIDTPHVDTPHVDTPHVDTPHVDTPHVDTPHADTPHVDTPHADTPHVDTPHADTPHVDTPQVDTTNVSVSDSFRKAIPTNGAYWNRLLHSALRQLNEGKYVFRKGHTSGPHCREVDQELLETNVHDFSSYSAQHQDFVRGMECRHPPILIDQPNKCRSSEGEGDGQTFLLLAIKSNPRSFERRQAVRETWGREGAYEGGLRVRTVFLLGSLSPDDPDLTQLLSFEAKHFGDLLHWDFRDSFFNLTLKEHAFYSWSLTRCPRVSFVFKGDDDVFVNTDAILRYLQSLESSKAAKIYAGQVISTAGPHRDPKIKYYIPMTFYEGPYPAYAGGGGYLFSGALLRPLYYVSLVIPFFPIDDVYSGMCFMALGISPESVEGFYTFDILEKDRDNICVHKSLLLVHQRSPQQVKKLWRGIHSPFLTC